VYVARRLVDYLTSQPVPGATIIVPVVNPDGYARRRRRNAAGVDLNRNFPTANWAPGNKRSRFYAGPSPASEPETKAIVALVETMSPARIISIHSIDKRRFCNNYDGPARALATKMAARNNYPVTGSIGYPTPGSLGTWAGIERSIPVVTLELPSHRSPRQCWLENRDALVAGCR
jgi:protein MpaA